MTNLEEVDPEDEPRTYRPGAPPASALVVVLAGVTVQLPHRVRAVLRRASPVTGASTTARAPRSSAVVDAAAPAHEAGLQTGDKVVAVNGKPVDELGRSLESSIERNGGNGDHRHRRARRPSSVDARRATPEDARAVRASSASRPGPSSATSSRARGGARVVRDDGHGRHRLRRRPRRPASRRRASSTYGAQSFTSATPKAGSQRRSQPPVSLVGIVDQRQRRSSAATSGCSLLLLGQINVFLGVFNLLPLLPFDGGHAAIAIYERIASKVQAPPRTTSTAAS